LSARTLFAVRAVLYPVELQLKSTHCPGNALAYSLLLKSGMAVLNLAEKPQAEFSYSHILRVIGQSLADLELKAFELASQGDVFLVHGWSKGTSLAISVDRRYTMEDVEQLDASARHERRQGSARNLLSVAHILRTAGNYIDLLGGKLIRVEWQSQSDKVQCLTIQYQAADEHDGAIDEVCVHIYKEKKKVRPLSVRPLSLNGDAAAR
jgi:hypothetical protein